MKKLIVLFVIMTASLFSQAWNNVVQTSIPFNYTSSSTVDLVTNKDGNHILVHYYSGQNDYLKYYLLNTSGSIVRSYTFETQSVQFACIDGADDRIYVVYKLGNQIKTKKSTNAGQNWSDIDPINIGNNTCNHMDITFGKDDNALHVVWATQDNGNDYETYYRRLPSSDQWDAQKTVTDYGNEVGGFPTVSKSQDRIYVSYNTGQYADPELNLGDAKSRDKYINTWQTPQLIFSAESFRERIHAGSSKLFDFYYKAESGMGFYYADLYVKERSFGSTSWSSPEILKYHAAINQIVSAANTYDGKTHIVYEILDGVGYRNYNGSTWSDEVEIGDEWVSPRISSISNDLFVAWGGFSEDYVYYRQYDAIPLAPQNLNVTQSQNNHPYFTWTANKEPDVNLYKIYRNAGSGPLYIGQTANTYFEDVTLSYCTATPPATCPENNYIYHVTAVDLVPNESNPSNTVRVRLVGAQEKASAYDPNSDLPLEYSLEQNYPNPFNPVTSINYQIKGKGFVALKVYDMLGREVSNLVNETQDEGQYSVVFNASNLHSGVYVYSLRVNDFVQNNKMTLLK